MHIVRRDSESFEEFLRRYKRNFTQSGILREYKRHRFFVGPSEARRLKQREAARRLRRRQRSRA
ncbi:MAG: 30S ribosomal protein S21 [Chloroflexi bacterium]|nr:30S ribosomal protein S21 [Chloroflexota bacterium]